MTNLDKLRAMGAEELAEKLNNKGKCGLCICEYEECIGCVNGITQWLNQEVNPKPKLQNGDILEFRYGFSEYIGVYTDDFVVLPKSKKSFCITDEDLEILAVWRISVTEGYKRLWRAE